MILKLKVITRMIKRVREMDENALIASKEFRDFVEKQETEINRGISVLCILSIIVQADKQMHGYKILKELTKRTKEMLIVEEGTLYPLLRKLEREGIVKSEKEKGGRRRKFYIITERGKQIYNHLSGYYSRLSEAILPLFDAQVNLNEEKFIFCPMCANKIELSDVKKHSQKFCEICGYNIEKELKERGVGFE